MRLRDDDAEVFRTLAHSVVSRTLAHECEYRRQGSPEPGTHEWRLIKRQNGLRVYKSHENGLARLPTGFCIGTIDGSLDDVLYGLHAKTRHEMRVANAFLSKGQVKCAVLSLIESGSDRDPSKQLALKWMLTQTVGDTRYEKYRDFCTLESMGTGVDGQGERFGYRLIKSVDLAEHPQLATGDDVVRAKMTMCCIFREDAASRTVRVYSKGMLDMVEDVPPSFLCNSDATCSMMLSIASATEIAEAKRLTLLALQRVEYVACSSYRKCDESELEEFFRDTESTTTTSPTITSPMAPTSPDAGQRGSFRQKSSCDTCSVCGKRPPLSVLVRASLCNCGVCQQRVCHKCQAKRRLFARSDAVAVACCKICVMAAKRLHVDPRDPCPMLSSPPM